MKEDEMSELKPCPFCGKMPAAQCSSAICINDDCELSDYWRGLEDDSWNTRPIEDALNARIAKLEAELKITDELLKEATETIGAVVACCTYNSNDDAKIGIYGIDQKAFTRTDQFITHYNDAISAGKVSVDVKRELSDAEIEELGAQEAEKRGEK